MRFIAKILLRIANRMDWAYPLSSRYSYRLKMVSTRGVEYFSPGVKIATKSGGQCMGVWHDPCGRYIETDENGVVVGWSTLNGDRIIQINGEAFKSS